VSPGIHKKFSQGEFKGCIREDLFNLLPEGFFVDPLSSIQRSGGEVIKSSLLRVALVFTVNGKRKIFLKRDRTKDWIDPLKYLILPSKGRKEWLVARQAQKKGIPVPQPLGWIERGRWGFLSESYYLSEAVGSGVSLIELLKSKEEIPIERLAKAVKKIHDAGLYHKDLHAGNFLWDGESFFLTDLHRAEILSSLSLDKRLWNLAQWFYSLRSIWEERDFFLFFRKYFGEKSLDLKKEKEMFQRIRSMMLRLQRRHLKSRTKRCLKESTEFSVSQEGGHWYYHRRDFPLEVLKKRIAEHLEISNTKKSPLVKDGPEVVISLLKEGDQGVVVKELRTLTFWSGVKELFRHSKGRKAWVNGNGLMVRGVSPLKPLGLVEERSRLGLKKSFFLMEALEEGQELDRYLWNGFQNVHRKRLFIKTFAEWLALLHTLNIYHRDMKACNILVSKKETSWNFHLLDLEDVSLNRKVKEKEVFKNFLQLNTSIPRTITKTDRLRFLKEYVRSNPILRSNDKNWITRLIRESKERGIVYVTPHGVVEERWV